jgi:hypothetical protein
LPALDATKVVVDANGDEAFRVNASITFNAGVSDAAKSAYFARNSLTVLGVTSVGRFFVRFADPGSTLMALNARLSQLQNQPEVLRVVILYRTGMPPQIDARFPSDGVGLRRSDWTSGASSLWAMREIRAPWAWGCETGLYGGTRPRIAVLEWSHDASHLEFASSSRVPWTVADPALASMPQSSQAKRDTVFRHAVAVTGVLTAQGDNQIGVAGVAWASNLYMYSLSDATRHTLPFNAGLWVLGAQLKADKPRIVTISIDQPFPKLLPDTSRAHYVEDAKKEIQEVLDGVPDLIFVVAAGNERYQGTAANYYKSSQATLLRSTLLNLKLNGYQDRIIVVSGTRRGNALWAVNQFNPAQGSNVYTDITGFAAPADSITVIDTVQSGQVPTYTSLGTSLAAPMVAAVAGELLSMDPTLTATQVTDYLLRGASVARYDSLSGTSSNPSPVSGYPFYQLDAYGSLSLLSRERSNVPICGYPISAGGLYVMLEKNGHLAAPTDSILVPGAANPIGRLSVAQGGRRIAVYTGTDTQNANNKAVIEINHLGQRTGSLVNYDGRIFTESKFANVRQVFAGTTWVEVTLFNIANGQSAGSILQAKFPDGSVVGSGLLDEFDVSPDGRFLSFIGFPQGATAGAYVQRFADQTTTAVAQCTLPCPGPTHPHWSHDGTSLLLASTELAGGTYTSYLQRFLVDSTAQGGFAGDPPVPVANTTFDRWYRYSGDDFVVYLSEGRPLIGATAWAVIRPANSLGTIAEQVLLPYRQERQVNNVATLQP